MFLAFIKSMTLFFLRFLKGFDLCTSEEFQFTSMGLVCGLGITSLTPKINVNSTSGSKLLCSRGKNGTGQG